MHRSKLHNTESFNLNHKYEVITRINFHNFIIFNIQNIAAISPVALFWKYFWAQAFGYMTTSQLSYD